MKLRTSRDPGLERLRSLSRFAGSSKQELLRLRALATELDIGAGHVLVDPDHPASQLFVIAEGIAETRVGTRVLARLGAGAVFGELGPRAHGPVTTVASATPLVVFVLSDQEFRSLPERLKVEIDRRRESLDGQPSVGAVAATSARPVTEVCLSRAGRERARSLRRLLQQPTKFNTRKV